MSYVLRSTEISSLSSIRSIIMGFRNFFTYATYSSRSCALILSQHFHTSSLYSSSTFCWVPSHCGIEGNEIVDQLAKETLGHDIDALATVHYADLKPLVNSYIQQEVQIKWDVSIHGRDLYLLKPTLRPPKKFKHLTRAEEVVITRLRIGHTKATKSYILSRGPPTACQHCGQTLTIEHMLLECTVLQQIRDEYYTADSLRTLFETIPETCIVEFLREAGFFYLIWKAIYPVQHIIRITHQLTTFGIYINHHILTPLDFCNLFIEHKQ